MGLLDGVFLLLKVELWKEDEEKLNRVR